MSLTNWLLLINTCSVVLLTVLLVYLFFQLQYVPDISEVL